jgi:hypothetical protein
VVAVLLAAALHTHAACTGDLDCFLNGVCSAGQCSCELPWGGAQCNQLITLPVQFPQGYGMTPNVTSWGGNVIFDGTTYHMFVAEMVESCPLTNWQSNSQCTHAVSDTITGPYTKQDAAVGVWCHNPAAVTLPDGTFALFHIGDGTGSNVVNCTTEAVPVDVVKSGDAWAGEQLPSLKASGSTIHVSKVHPS